MTGALEAMAALGLPVTWAVVRLGWEGPGALGPQIDVDDVHAFADGAIAAADPAVRSFVAELSLAPGGAEVAEGLQHLARLVVRHRRWLDAELSALRGGGMAGGSAR